MNSAAPDARVSWSRLGIIGRIILDVALFVLTTTALAYLSENHSWAWFAAVAGIGVAIYCVLRLLDSKAAIKYFKYLEGQEFRLTKRMARSGIVDFYDMQYPEEQARRNEDTRSAILQARTMSLVANSGASYLDPGVERHWPAIEHRLKSGIGMNVLLLDPFSQEKSMRDRINLAGDPPDSKFRFDLLCKLYNDYPHLHVRIARSNMYCTVFITDDAAFYDPYHLGKIGNRITNRFLCFRVKNQPSEPGVESPYTILRKHFEASWQLADDFENYFSSNRAQVVQAVPAVANITLVRRHSPSDQSK